jgi:hypothetical protein
MKGFHTSPEIWSQLLYGIQDNSSAMECIINELPVKPFSKLIAQFDNIARSDFTNLLQIKHKLKILSEEQLSDHDETHDSTWKTIITSLQFIEDFLISLT